MQNTNSKLHVPCPKCPFREYGFTVFKAVDAYFSMYFIHYAIQLNISAAVIRVYAILNRQCPPRQTPPRQRGRSRAAALNAAAVLVELEESRSPSVKEAIMLLLPLLRLGEELVEAKGVGLVVLRLELHRVVAPRLPRGTVEALVVRAELPP